MKTWLKNSMATAARSGGAKALSVLAVGLFLSLSCLLCVQAGWVKTPEWRYVDEDGTQRRGTWYKDERGGTYYLDESGRLVTGFYDIGGGDIRFFDSSGYLRTGLVELDGTVYFLDEQGKPVRGDVVVNGELCTFGECGLRDGRVTVPRSQRFYHDESGALVGGVDVSGRENWNLPAFLALILGAALVLACRHAKKWNPGKALFVFLAVMLCSMPLFLPYFWRGHDFDFHISRLLGMKASLENGMFPVRLDSFTFNGYGYGSAVFYPSLFLYLPALLMAVGVPLVDAVNVWLFVINLAAAAVMYISASGLFGSKKAGCVAAVLYTTSLYRLGNLYTRAAWGELMAMIFFPLIVWGFYEIFFRDARKWPLLVLGLTGVLQSHIISTAVAAVGCTVAGFLCIKRLADRNRFWACIKTVVVAFCLNAWFIIPLLDYMRAGMNLSALQFHAENFAAPFIKLFELFPPAMGATPASDGPVSGLMALGPGLPILAATGLFLYQELPGGKKGGTDEIQRMKEIAAHGEQEHEKTGERVPVKLLWLFVLIGVAAMFAATQLFPWRTLMQFSWFEFLASYIQFPWRLIAVATCFLSMVGGYAVSRQWRGKTFAGVAAGLLLFCAVFSQHLVEGYYEASDFCWRESDIDSMISQKEYLYENTDRDLARGSRLPAGEGIEVTDSCKNGLTVDFSYVSDMPGTETRVKLPLFYYPGYRAVDGHGNELPVSLSEEGLAQVHFAVAPEGEIHVAFRERRLWRISEAVSLAAGLILSGMGIRRYRKKK